MLTVPATVSVDGTGNSGQSGRMGRELLLSAACPHTTVDSVWKPHQPHSLNCSSKCQGRDAAQALWPWAKATVSTNQHRWINVDAHTVGFHTLSALVFALGVTTVDMTSGAVRSFWYMVLSNNPLPPSSQACLGAECSCGTWSPLLYLSAVPSDRALGSQVSSGGSSPAPPNGR